MNASGVGTFCCRGGWGPRDGVHGPWCIDCGQRGRGESAVGQFSCDSKFWEPDDQEEVVDWRLWLGQEARRLSRKSCERGVLQSGRSLTRDHFSTCSQRGKLARHTITTTPFSPTFSSTGCICTFPFALFLSISDLLFPMVPRRSTADLLVAPSRCFCSLACIFVGVCVWKEGFAIRGKRRGI